jgi:ankyrin repeat protein
MRCAPDSKITCLIQSGADPNLTVSNGDPPLIWALHHSSYKPKPLLENGVDPNVYDSNDAAVITVAIGYVRPLSIIEMLIKSGADLNPTTRCSPLIQATQSGAVGFCKRCKLEVIETLVESGADPNLPLYDDNRRIIMLPLYAAARFGQLRDEIDQIKLLLMHGANPNGIRRDGITALHGTAENDDVDYAVEAC